MNNASASSGAVDDAAARLRRRYQKARFPRPLLIGLIALGAAAALSWLVWAGVHFATPPVAARVFAFEVTSDTSIDVTLSVDRRDPSRPATCRVSAQAYDVQTVGELTVSVPPSDSRVVDVKVAVATLRRAAAARLNGCSLT